MDTHPTKEHKEGGTWNRVKNALKKGGEKAAGAGIDIGEAVKSATQKLEDLARSEAEKLPGIGKGVKALEKEAKIAPTLHASSRAALRRMMEERAEIREAIDKAYAYAVFPDIGKAAVVLGGTYGLGEVFKHDKVIGYAAAVQVTIGVQVGGQTFHQLLIFENREALKRFKEGKVGFAANASLTMVKAGAATAHAPPPAMRSFLYSDGGMLVESAIGVQKFVFKPAVLGRGKEAGIDEEADEERREEQPER